MTLPVFETERYFSEYEFTFLGVKDRYVRFGFGRKNFEEALAAYEKVLERQT
jgi:hypothetical protein